MGHTNSQYTGTRPSVVAKVMEPVFRLTGIKTATATPAGTERQLRELEIRPERFAPPRSLARHAQIHWAREWPSYTIYDTPTSTRLVYLHGGGFVTEIKPWHWQLAATLAKRLHARAEIPVYPLAPRKTAAFTVPALADYIGEIIDKVGADNVAVAGDSAGASLALSTAQHLLAAGRPVPAALVLISPWLDATMSDPVQYQRRDCDRMMSIPGLIIYAERFAGGLALDDPLVSPVFGSYKGLPPTQIITGTSDIFHVDALKFIERARAAGVDIDSVVARGLQHIYPLFPFIPEGRREQRRIETFLRTYLP